ncbi:MAG: hypothetical protein KDD53_11000, partial [Bdellovibrionales bacterium]|nr:hypothetical protein [Bdellovibrionales bacterium]
MTPSSLVRLLSWRVFLLVLLVATILSDAYGATVTWVNPSSGDWGIGSNWSSGTIPGPSDDVVINSLGGIVVTISSGDQSINSLSAAGGLHLVGGSLSVAAGSTVSGELLISSGATLTVSGSSATFDALGPTNIDGAKFSIANGGKASFPNVTTYDITETHDEVITVD